MLHFNSTRANSKWNQLGLALGLPLELFGFRLSMDGTPSNFGTYVVIKKLVILASILTLHDWVRFVNVIVLLRTSACQQRVAIP